MPIIVRAYSEVNGQIAQASSVNRVIDDLYANLAGNVDSSNIARSGINSSNYANSSIGNPAIQTSAILIPNVAGSAVVDLVLRHEVFG